MGRNSKANRKEDRHLQVIVDLAEEMVSLLRIIDRQHRWMMVIHRVGQTTELEMLTRRSLTIEHRIRSQTEELMHLMETQVMALEIIIIIIMMEVNLIWEE